MRMLRSRVCPRLYDNHEGRCRFGLAGRSIGNHLDTGLLCYFELVLAGDW